MGSHKNNQATQRPKERNRFKPKKTFDKTKRSPRTKPRREKDYLRSYITETMEEN